MPCCVHVTRAWEVANAMAKPSKRLLLACCLFAPLPVYWTYRAAFSGEWEWHMGHDDGINFVNNKRIQSLSFENLQWMWQDGVLLGKAQSTYARKANIPRSLTSCRHATPL